MSYRQDIVDSIKPHLPASWTVQDYADEPDVRVDPIVMVETTDIDPARSGVPRHYDITTHIYCITPNLDDAKRDADAADDAVLILLDVILRMRNVTQGNAKRMTFQGGHPCWDITINIEARVRDDEESETP